jgi:hypothetical protein
MKPKHWEVKKDTSTNMYYLYSGSTGPVPKELKTSYVREGDAWKALVLFQASVRNKAKLPRSMRARNA